MSGWEEAAFHAINDLPDWLYAPMWVFQLAGPLFVPVIVAVGAGFFRRWQLAAALIIFVPLKLIVEKLVVKQLVERERPGTTICGAPDDFDEACGNFRGDVPLDGLSFVSGHTIKPCSTRPSASTSAPTTCSTSSAVARSAWRSARCW